LELHTGLHDGAPVQAGDREAQVADADGVGVGPQVAVGVEVGRGQRGVDVGVTPRREDERLGGRSLGPSLVHEQRRGEAQQAEDEVALRHLLVVEQRVYQGGHFARGSEFCLVRAHAARSIAKRLPQRPTRTVRPARCAD